MPDIAVAGKEISVIPYLMVGADVFTTDRVDDIYQFARDILIKDYKVVLVGETYFFDFLKVYNDLAEFGSDRLPVIVPVVEGIKGKNVAFNYIKQLIEKAVGIDLFKEDDDNK